MAIIKMVLYQPTYSCLLTLNQSPKDNAGSDITNCLTHTSRMTGYAVIVQSRAETYHFFVRLACYLVINPSSKLAIILSHTPGMMRVTCFVTTQCILVPGPS